MAHHPSYGPVEVLYDGGIFLESPRWQDGAYWFSDIGAGKVWRIDEAGQQAVVASGLLGPSGLGWTSSGDLLVATLHDSTIHRVGADGRAQPFIGADQHRTLGTNDMATFGSRSYVSCSGHVLQPGDGEDVLSKPNGVILEIDHATAACKTVARGMQMPNGIAVTPDGKTLIVAELYACRVLKFAILPNGELGHPQVFAQFNHIVDGLCLDAEGGLWLGTGLDYFLRVDANGNPTDTVTVPGWSCVAPMLGGSDGRTFIMATNHMEKPDDILSGKAKGRIVTVRVDAPAALQPKQHRNN